MDPNEILRRALEHISTGQFDAAEDAIGDYNQWIGMGGFAGDDNLIDQIMDYADLLDIHPFND